jgi:hypothetical protein
LYLFPSLDHFPVIPNIVYCSILNHNKNHLCSLTMGALYVYQSLVCHLYFSVNTRSVPLITTVCWFCAKCFKERNLFGGGGLWSDELPWANASTAITEERSPPPFHFRTYIYVQQGETEKLSDI